MFNGLAAARQTPCISSRAGLSRPWRCGGRPKRKRARLRSGQITDEELEKKIGSSGLCYSFGIKSANATYKVRVDAKTGGKRAGYVELICCLYTDMSERINDNNNYLHFYVTLFNVSSLLLVFPLNGEDSMFLAHTFWLPVAFIVCARMNKSHIEGIEDPPTHPEAPHAKMLSDFFCPVNLGV